ncbi:Zn-dependent hydrolase [Salinimonas marina]|uniref:Zn-dependent hydrolase n=1 Tax=Salinimonas marina TaxID=2785918 RepID=UPI0038CD163E
MIAPVALAALLDEYAVHLPFHLDVVGFGDEEGTRFGSTLLGSRALTHSWPASWRNSTDAQGVCLPDALQQFGLDFDKVSEAAIDPDEVLGFLELHIEQGPVLEDEDLPVGIVSAIAGARRFEFRVTGMAGHAGTVPMRLRQDALTASAKIIVCIEKLAIEHKVVATVGQIKNQPNGVNVIAGETLFSLDIRSSDDLHRDAVTDLILEQAQCIARHHQVKLLWRQTHEAAAVACDPQLQSVLKQAVTASQLRPFFLSSGAGHDAMALAQICPVAMLFTRCKGGISHHPDESITTEDIMVSLQVLFETVILLARQYQST